MKWIGSIIAAIFIFIVLGSLFVAASGAFLVVTIIIAAIITIAVIATVIKIELSGDK